MKHIKTKLSYPALIIIAFIVLLSAPEAQSACCVINQSSGGSCQEINGTTFTDVDCRMIGIPDNNNDCDKIKQCGGSSAAVNNCTAECEKARGGVGQQQCYADCVKAVNEGRSSVINNNNNSTGNGSSSASLTYTPMENIPGFESVGGDFVNYILAVYKFGIWTVGIAALLMITLGGFMYITSAGNNASMGRAKSVIGDAIIGIVMALSAYLLLKTINPELVRIQSINQALEKAASSYNGQYPNINTGPMPQNCSAQEWQQVFSAASSSTGIDKCALQAVAAIESGCNKTPQRTHNGQDCGVTQIRAQDNCGTTCDDLEQNPQKAVECTARYLQKCSSKWRTNNEEQKIRDMYAGYNGGCGALDASNSCSGMTNSYGNPYQKWDCPKDCGGYCPVPGRTSIFLNYYNQCKGS